MYYYRRQLYGQVNQHLGMSKIRRPALIKDRAVPGHWEGDLIYGSKNSYIATVVERQSRFAILVKVDGKNTEAVVSALRL